MAKTPEAVSTFLAGLRDRAMRHYPEKLKELLRLKRDDLSTRGLPTEDELFSWDVAYYQRLRNLKQHAVNPEKISEYFPLRPTVDNMLKVFGSLFGFVFILVEGEDRDRLSSTGKGSDLVWHDDVIMYSVWDDQGEGGDFRGYLYLDLYFRQGKHRGYQSWPLNLGFESADGKKRYPATILMTIFPKPAEGRPSLLNQGEVKLLFHELGHCIHDLSGGSKCSKFFGAVRLYPRTKPLR
jgi:metallopeptidase MepB